tara:strand:- start:3226 stop:3912 length:687 start_codon:yes stop_codon:yes gene_type:complete
MSNICIIPARGNSKRIAKKNIKHFFGKPIIAYSIEAAIKSGLFDEVMVSTDNKEIAEIAKTYGAKIPFYRSKKNSDDFATTYDVIEEVIKKYKNEGKEFKNICCIYSCAPFVTESKLNLGFKKLIENTFDTVFPIIEYSFPIERAVKITNGKITPLNAKYLDTRSQDLTKSYHDAGQFYWMKTQKILASNKIITDNCGGIVITEMEGQDIDTEIDWNLAEMKFKYLLE